MNREATVQHSKVFKALSIPIRLKLLEQIAREGPIDLKSLMDSTGLKEPTIRHHLLVLERANLVNMTEDHQGTRGRPRMLISMTKENWEVGYPRRQYFLLAEHLLKHVIEKEGIKGAVETMREIGRSVAKDLIDEARRKKGYDKLELSDVAEIIIPALDEFGSMVEAIDTNGDSLAVQMRNCIYFELAQTYPGVVCEGHAAIFETIADAMDGGYESTADSCLAHGDEFCQNCLRRRS